MSALPELFDLKAQVALVTGAASGLGIAIAEAMAQAGADVALFDIDADGLAQTAARVTALGRRALPLVVDIGDEDAVERAFEAMDNSATQNWMKVTNVNLHGTFFCARAALARMVPRRRGKLINVASMWGLAGPSSIFPLPAYAATKGAVVNLTRELALQYAPLGINVNAICPGFFRTNVGPYDDPEFMAATTGFTPAGRIADAEEIKGTALYLASQASSFVHGAILVIDGGCMAK
jgi:NAD(P)-dependent dehydrogenase (short-subunit alcohol dehydrogenase family)